MKDDPCPLLVIALVGRVGSGVSFVRDKILQELKTYKYDTEVIDVSDVFLDRFYESYAEEDSQSNDLTSGSKADRTRELQRRGNYLREKHGPEFVARAAFQDFIATDIGSEPGLENRRAYIIDSLKNPQESLYLRRVFGLSYV